MSSDTTREKILKLGKSYIQIIGYHSFNYKMIAAQLGIKNASIHYYFPTKEDLAIAIIEKDAQDFRESAKKLEGKSATEKAEFLLEGYTGAFNDGNKLCLQGAFESSFNDISEDIQKAAIAYVELIFKWLTSVFEDGLQINEFTFKGSAEEMAAVWMASLPGSLLIGRVKGAVSFNQIINRLRNSLKEG
jgi:TetR/AcrR family transcriptional repressor of nem operon